jgi:hypothetical protein
MSITRFSSIEARNSRSNSWRKIRPTMVMFSYFLQIIHIRKYSELNHLVPSSFAAYKEQLVALGTVPGEQDLATKALADLKTKLVKEKAA